MEENKKRIKNNQKLNNYQRSRRLHLRPSLRPRLKGSIAKTHNLVEYNTTKGEEGVAILKQVAAPRAAFFEVLDITVYIGHMIEKAILKEFLNYLEIAL